jgi:hypothetical protein
MESTSVDSNRVWLSYVDTKASFDLTRLDSTRLDSYDVLAQYFSNPLRLLLLKVER